MSLFLFLSSISLGRYCWERLTKSRGFRKKMLKGGYDHTASQYHIDYDVERLKESGPIGTLSYRGNLNWRGTSDPSS